jgi:uncharacterized phage protein (TIGR01671 family)
MSILKYRAYDGKSVRYDVTGFEHFNENEMGSVFIDGDCYKIVKSMDEKNYSQFPSAVVDQYTGLKDKNGVEIYEGDILDFDEKEWRGEFKSEAVPPMIMGEWNMCGAPSDVSEWRQVIGNIHENPELLLC